jgi:DNA-binding transcriptional LysR family regulator
MDIRQLEYFVAVAEELSFTKAAARCHVVQSALSYQVARLERENGVLLFERSSRSVRLAAAGALLLPRARTVLAEVELARAELTALAGVLTGRLRLGMIGTATVAAPVVGQALAEFHRRHPGVEITIQDTGSARMADQVRDGDIDLAFVGLFADQLSADVVHRVLAVEPLVAVVSPEHPLAASRSVGLAELAVSGPLIEMRAESGLRRQVDAAFGRAGVTRSVAFELGASDAVVRFVGLGFGSAVVPASAAAGRTDIRVLGLRDQAALHPVSLIHRNPAPSAPGARAFLSLLSTDRPGADPDRADDRPGGDAAADAVLTADS